MAWAKPEKEKTIEELVRNQDLYGRLALAFGVGFMIYVTVVLTSLVFSGGTLLTRTQQQVEQLKVLVEQQKTIMEQQKANTEELKRDTAEQLAKQTAYIRCLAQFFELRNRASNIISNIDSCVIEKVAQSSSAPSSSGVSQVAPSQPVASQPQSSQPTAPVRQEPTTSSPGPDPQPTQPSFISGVLSLPQKLLTGLLKRN